MPIRKSHYSYESIQSHSKFENGEGRVQVMEVSIKNGKGHKKVTLKNKNGRKIVSKTIDLNDDEINRIMKKEFIPGLFRPCLDHCSTRLSNRTRRNNAVSVINNM
jgi:hypothetical protein